jgi:predicted AlkP superfamily pyrophosphatase or phosphodiesterase
MKYTNNRPMILKSKSPMKSVLTTCLLLSLANSAFAQSQLDTTQHIDFDNKNSIKQQQKPYVILISADGFRHDYAKRYKANHLLELSRNGVQAESMIPSYPTVTFPNHYSIATGLYPSHHGLVNNTFYDKKKASKYSMGAKDKVRDGSWYGGTPLWVLAEQQKMLAANMFWVGSEAAIKNTRATYYYDFNDKMKVEQRIQTVKEWLSLPADRRPHFITFYVSEPDHSGHSYGPEALETQQAVKMVDSIIYKLTEAVKTTGLPVNYVFVSDHGMTAVDRENPIPIPKEIDMEKFIIPSSGTMVDIQAKNKADILPLYNKLKMVAKDYDVYMKAEVPEELHYNAKNDRMDRIGDILLLPHWPKVFSNRKPGAGYHGFEPLKVKDMHATFFAWGPAFKSNIKIPAFENVNVYPLIAQILGLNISEKIDGEKRVLKKILK